MEDRQNVYRALDTEWVRVGETAAARAALARWAMTEPALARFSSPAEVVRNCRRRHDADGANVLLAGILRHAHEPLAARTVLQAVLPGLAAQVRRRTRHSGVLFGDGGVPWESVEDLDGEVVTRALETIAGLAGTSVERCPQAIIDAAWVRLRAGAARRERRSQLVVMPLADAPELPAAPDRSAADELAAVIVRAVRDRTLARHDAAVVYTSRVLGHSLGELAAAQGRDVRAVRLQRVRAERLLARRC